MRQRTSFFSSPGEGVGYRVLDHPVNAAAFSMLAPSGRLIATPPRLLRRRARHWRALATSAMARARSAIDIPIDTSRPAAV